MLIWVSDEKKYIYFSVSVVHMLWNKISPSFIEKQGKCILAAQRIGKFEYWIFTQPNKNIFSLIFLCEGTERNFYFKRKYASSASAHWLSGFNISHSIQTGWIVQIVVLKVKIINRLNLHMKHIFYFLWIQIFTYNIQCQNRRLVAPRTVA